jgi:hypothetical protein
MYSTTEAMITIAAISMGHSIRRPPVLACANDRSRALLRRVRQLNVS